MSSLPEHVNRTPAIRPRSFALMVAPCIGERATPLPDRFFEEAALTVIAHVFRDAGPIREALVYERRRFERLVQLIHRLPARGGGG